MKKGQNRFPPSQFRLKEEDLLREADSSAKEVQDNTYTLMDNYQESVELRGIKYQENKEVEPDDDDDEDGDEYDDPNREPTTRGVRILIL